MRTLIWLITTAVKTNKLHEGAGPEILGDTHSGDDKMPSGATVGQNGSVKGPMDQIAAINMHTPRITSSLRQPNVNAWEFSEGHPKYRARQSRVGGTWLTGTDLIGVVRIGDVLACAEIFCMSSYSALIPQPTDINATIGKQLATASVHTVNGISEASR